MELSVLIEKDEDGFFLGTVAELPGCHTQAKSLDELQIRLKEVIELCLEEYGDSFKPLQFVGLQRITAGR